MIITAIMAGYDKKAKKYFDGLWRYSRKFPSEINSNLMSWKIKNNKPVDGQDSSFDGDADIAFALLLADAQWGSNGKINYKKEAIKVINAIKKSVIGPNSYLPKLGDWVENDTNNKYNEYTPRSSDFMLVNFRAFYNATNDDTWLKVINASIKAMKEIQNNYSEFTGLLPDFLVNCQDGCQPAEANFLEGKHDGEYYYNAGRDPWRIGLDYILNGNKDAKNIVDKMENFILTKTDEDASNIKAGYDLDGNRIGNYFTSFFVAPFGVGAMIDSKYQNFLNSVYKEVRKEKEDYYEDSINLLSLLIMSHNFWTVNKTNSNSSNIKTNKKSKKNRFKKSSSLKITQEKTSEWYNGYCENVTVYNPTNHDIKWKVKLKIDGVIYDKWSAKIKQINNIIYAKGVNWNKIVEAKSKQEFGFCANLD